MALSAQGNLEDPLVRTVRIGRLLEVYGPLLTERQREFVRLHHDEDLSFGEIASEYGISRQAVHDAVRQAEAAMEHYEAGLHLLERPLVRSAAQSVGPNKRRENSDTEDLESAIAELETFRQRLATQGIIYDATEYVRQLGSILERLRKCGQ